MSRRPVISQAMEDYLKAIYELSRGEERVSTSRVAERLECTPASVTNMLQKLSSLNLVEYARYRGVKLTSAGTKVALEVLRHHRLIELYLSEVLGYSWDKVHAEADRLEHVISEEFEDRIDEALGFPAKDPHGDPIPTKDYYRLYAAFAGTQMAERPAPFLPVENLKGFDAGKKLVAAGPIL